MFSTILFSVFERTVYKILIPMEMPPIFIDNTIATRASEYYCCGVTHILKCYSSMLNERITIK